MAHPSCPALGRVLHGGDEDGVGGVPAEDDEEDEEDVAAVHDARYSGSVCPVISWLDLL